MHVCKSIFVSMFVAGRMRVWYECICSCVLVHVNMDVHSYEYSRILSEPWEPSSGTLAMCFWFFLGLNSPIRPDGSVGQPQRWQASLFFFLRCGLQASSTTPGCTQILGTELGSLCYKANSLPDDLSPQLLNFMIFLFWFFLILTREKEEKEMHTKHTTSSDWGNLTS